MDEIVKQAIAKWPNVPHCYGWLALDARGAWRMLDERAQALGLPGDKIVHAALLGFINRNYAHDDRGRWYFQNGPQRVYVNLEATPYVARTDPIHGFVLHTGAPLEAIDAASLTDSGQLILTSEEKIALVDDRDMAHCLAAFRLSGAKIDDDELLALLGNAEGLTTLSFDYGSKQIPLQWVARQEVANYFKFDPAPQPDQG